MQVLQLHASAGGANFFIKSLTELTTGLAGLGPGFGVSQAAHFVLLASLLTKHISQDQEPAVGANLTIKSLLIGTGFLGAGFPVEGLDD